MAKKKKAKKAKSKSAGNIARPTTFSDKQFRVENAADTMMRFQEVKSDKKLMADAKKELARREKAIKRARGA